MKYGIQGCWLYCDKMDILLFGIFRTKTIVGRINDYLFGIFNGVIVADLANLICSGWV